MPRPMFRAPAQRTQQQQQTQYLDPKQKQKTKTKQMSQIEIDRLLRKPRSKEYMDAIHKLDAGGRVYNRNKVNSMIAAIQQEFPELELAGISMMVGIVSKCYLGAPYEVHSLDISGAIIEHYKAFQKMPDGLEKARGLALHGGYDFIEVYTDCCRAISPNGQVSVIR